MPLTQKAIKRIQVDITNIQAEEIKAQGIYYIHDDADISKGTALIIGPRDTPYEGGYYFFSVAFPDDYPFNPPAMTTLTQDGVTRFNPNMYREGKVCLSLLNTWHVGDKWSGCQTLTSVLLSIVGSVLTNKPLENEPGFDPAPAVAETYSRMITHANLQTAVLYMLTRTPSFAIPFYDEMTEAFHKNRQRLIDIGVAHIDWDNKTDVFDFFRMHATYKFSTLADKIRECVPREPLSGSGGGGPTNRIL
jgi:ubiquitin-conjugating enzyme E2 Z